MQAAAPSQNETLGSVEIQRVAYGEKAGQRGWYRSTDGRPKTVMCEAWLLSSNDRTGSTRRTVYDRFETARQLANSSLEAAGVRAAFPPCPDDWRYDVAGDRLENLANKAA